MSLKARFLAVAAAGAFLLVAACGGLDSDTNPPAAITKNPHIGCPDLGYGACSIWGVVPTTVRYVAIDLSSDGYGSMSGWGIGDGEQVGDCLCGQFGTERALLWRGSASSLVNLHPDGFTASSGSATSGGVQIGFGRIGGHTHALKWAGSANSVVDLHPTGFDSSEAVGISGDQIAGFGRIGDEPHALLWTSRGVVDLHPRGFSGSIAFATDGSKLVLKPGKETVALFGTTRYRNGGERLLAVDNQNKVKAYSVNPAIENWLAYPSDPPPSAAYGGQNAGSF